MLSHYNAAVEYIKNEKAFLGDDHAGVVATSQAQLKHFVDSLPSFDRDVTVSGDLLARIRGDDSEAFTLDQRRSIASAVSVHMRGVSTGSTPGTNDTKTQTHMFMYKWLPNELWDTLMNAELSQEQVFSAIIDWFLKIGLRFPDDETVKQIIGIMNCCEPQGDHTDAAKNYASVHLFKRRLRAKRDTYGGATTFSVFPEDAEEFETLYPDRYDEPGAPRVSLDLIREMTHKDVMPTRSTNAMLKSGHMDQQLAKPRRGQRTSFGGNPSFSQSVNAGTPPTQQQNFHGGNMMQQFMQNQQEQRDMQQRMFQYMIGGNSDVPINIFRTPQPADRSPSPPPPAPTSTTGMAALVNHFRSSNNEAASPVAPAPQQVAAVVAGGVSDVVVAPPQVLSVVGAAPQAEKTSLLDLIKTTQSCLAQKKERAAAVRAKKTKKTQQQASYGDTISMHSDCDAESDANDADDDDASDDAHHIPPKSKAASRAAAAHASATNRVCKRPAAAMSTTPILRPAACIDGRAVVPAPPLLKRPAAHIAPDVPTQQLPAVSKAPVTFGGGKIYYNAKKNLFRVYARSGDRIEKVVGALNWEDKDAMRSKWRKACNIILNDPRPVPA